MAGVKWLDFLTVFDGGDDVDAGSKDYAAQLASPTGFNGLVLAQIVKKFANIFKVTANVMSDTLGDDIIHKEQLHADVAGTGLGQNANGSLELAVDGVGKVNLNADVAGTGLQQNADGSLELASPLGLPLTLGFAGGAGNGFCYFNNVLLSATIGVVLRQARSIIGISVCTSTGIVESTAFVSGTYNFAANDRVSPSVTTGPDEIIIYKNGAAYLTWSLVTGANLAGCVIVLDFA